MINLHHVNVQSPRKTEELLDKTVFLLLLTSYSLVASNLLISSWEGSHTIGTN